MLKRLILVFGLMVPLAMWSQGGPGQQAGHGGHGGGSMMGREGGMHHRGPMGKWWKNSEIASKLQLTDAQVQKLEQTFQDHRLKLIDLHANVEREEAKLDPLVESDNPNEDQVLSQIDRIAAARAELEKANARMMLSVRKVVSLEQWKKLQEMQPRPMMRRMGVPAQAPVGPGTPPPPPPPAQNQ
jgi:Spy/CpxP family protein refolding chaperone